MRGYNPDMRFLIRDILWFTVVAAVATTCCLERDKRVIAQKQFRDARALLTAKSRDVQSLGKQLAKLKDSYDRLKQDNKKLVEYNNWLKNRPAKQLTGIQDTNQTAALASPSTPPPPALKLQGSDLSISQ